MASLTACKPVQNVLPSSVTRCVPVKCAAKKGDASLVAAAFLATPFPALARTADVDVDKIVGATVDGVQGAGEVLKDVYGKAVSAADYAGKAYDKLSPQINEYVNQATPVIKQGIDEVSKVAGPAIGKATPIVQAEGTKLLQQSGLDLTAAQSSADTISKNANSAYTAVAPVVNKVAGVVTTSTAEELLTGALVVAGVYYLSPFLFKVIAGSLRGYSGEVSPATAVDLVATQDNTVLVDLRSVKEKQATGVPDVPSSAKGRFLELETVEIERRVRGQLRSPESVENKITALEIQALKRVNKGTSLLLLDRNGSGAKDVAKQLAGLGFGKVFVVSGGYSNWISSKLQIRQPMPSGQQQNSGIMTNIIGTISTRKMTPGPRRNKTPTPKTIRG